MNERHHYDTIVVGLGGIGSGALYWLSKRLGDDVLGIEQFGLGHHNGGSQDVSRIIRNLYHLEAYTKLTPHTYTAWNEVERESGIQLVWQTGGIEFGERHVAEKAVKAYSASLRNQNIDYEVLTGSELERRFPQLKLGPNYVGTFEPRSGLVDAQNGNSLHIQLARANGAKVLANCSVHRVSQPLNADNDRFTAQLVAKNSNGSDNETVIIDTSNGQFTCRHLVITAGAWLNELLGSAGVHIPVAVTQEQVTYVETPNPRLFTKDKFPVMIYHTPTGYDIYTLPIHSNSYFKLGCDAAGPVVTGNSRTFVPDPKREKVCMDFLDKHLPAASGPIAYSKTCLYTMTMDRHFVIDNLRNWATYGLENVTVCCGAGHAYKFASLLGRILADLAVDGRTPYDISFFNADRPAVVDKNFTACYRNYLQHVDNSAKL